MHKLMLNAVWLELHLVARTAFLVKADTKGANFLHPERPDMMALRAKKPDGTETVFLPGSSIKGVVRSSAERILRTVAARDSDRAACDPLDQKNRCQKEASSLGDARARSQESSKWPHPMAEVHKMLCLACRTFGSQAMAARIRFRDAFPTEDSFQFANATEERAGVSIDRRTGGPSKGKLYNTEVVPGGVFETVVEMQNVQLWQLALLGIVLEDVNMGLTRFGSAKTRGLGVFDAKPQRIVFRQVARKNAPSGVGALAPDLVEPYDLIAGDVLEQVPAGVERTDKGLFQEWAWEGEQGWKLLHAVQQAAWPGLLDRLGANA